MHDVSPSFLSSRDSGDVSDASDFDAVSDDDEIEELSTQEKQTAYSECQTRGSEIVKTSLKRTCFLSC